MNNNYYVYGLFNPDNLKVPLYIGKGIRNRKDLYLKNIKRGNSNHNHLVDDWIKELLKKKKEPVSVILFDKLLSGDAYVREAELILKYGRKRIDKNGILLNRSSGFEHFNVSNIKGLKEKIKLINTREHFNTKHYPKYLIKKACDLYKLGVPLKELRPMLYKQIGWSISYSKIRDFLVEQGFHIRTKSETKIGKSHPHGPNKGFTGHHHTVSSKKQISKTLALHAVNIKGEAYYRFGKLCKRGHDYNGTGKSLRLKSDGSCLECKKVLRIEKLLMKNKS